MMEFSYMHIIILISSNMSLAYLSYRLFIRYLTDIQGHKVSLVKLGMAYSGMLLAPILQFLILFGVLRMLNGFQG